jgi:outer membrane protein assembly factor BamD (BamD/ComL family)
MVKKKLIRFFLLCTFLFSCLLYGKEEMTVQEHYSSLSEAFQQQHWKDLRYHSSVILDEFPDSPFSQEAKYYQAISLFYLKEYEQANIEFSQYLKKITSMQHFEDAIQYKFQIAEKFRTGTRARLFGWKRLPRMLSAAEQAMQIYDEVISSLPNHDLAARSLYGKGKLLLKDYDFRFAIEVFQTLIRRFPKHELAPEAYVEIAKAYFIQCKEQYPDPDHLDLAEINLKKFRQDFPGDQRFELADNYLAEMHELFAKQLFETGHFFERTKKYNAAVIYYTQLLRKYPMTQIALNASERLARVQAKINKMEKKKEAPIPAPLSS